MEKKRKNERKSLSLSLRLGNFIISEFCLNTLIKIGRNRRVMNTPNVILIHVCKPPHIGTFTLICTDVCLRTFSSNIECSKWLWGSIFIKPPGRMVSDLSPSVIERLFNGNENGHPISSIDYIVVVKMLLHVMSLKCPVYFSLFIEDRPKR